MSAPVILLPLDGSMQALAAVPVAKVLAEIEQLRLQVLHVGHVEQSETDLREVLSHGTHVLDGIEIGVRIGKPESEIAQVARELGPRQIVICRHSRPRPAKLLGHTAMTVLRDSPCPVVLVPPERGVASWRLQHMLVPHDGTPSTSAALRPAMALAARADAELLVAHVTDVRAGPEEPGSYTTPLYVDHPQYEWPAWGNEFAQRLACLCPLGHLHVRVLLAHGDPAAEILEFSEKQPTDMIVLAWRGRWEVPRAAILKDVLRLAKCPIMVVRANRPSADLA
ncbi:MAG: universal stress protein [Hyphomicrobiaceae bacterium]|jgi:nucleotide-binding universal stress UspA family protein|nr:universal stress protein [Hyphomicrobiaceae bacterium]